MSLYSNNSSYTFSRPPEAIDEFAAALESVRGGTSINPEVERLKRNFIMQEAMQKNDANKAFDFLQDYMQTRLKLPARLLSPEMESLFKLMLEEQDSIPSFSVDPSKLDLREYRRPGPSYPGEHLERDNFLKINRRSPLSSIVTDEVVAIAPTATPFNLPVPRSLSL
jgi:hypothetical protein